MPEPIEFSIPYKFGPFIEKEKRYKIAIGGRGSGKSQTVSDLCLMDAQGQGMKIGCFREYMNSIDDSVHSLLSEEVERLGMTSFDVQAQKITGSTGGEFRYKGLARNIESIKSMHGFKRFWIEEAQTLSQSSIQLLTPTLRTEGSEIWMTANPLSRADPFSQRFVVPYERELFSDGYYEDDMHLIIVVNYMDNPFFPATLEQERLHDKDYLSPNLYRHIWLGHFNDEVDGAIIPAEWFDAAIDAHVKLGFKSLGQKIAAHDPSDLGPDSKGYAIRHGSVVLDVSEKIKGDINEGCDWATTQAIVSQADVFRWDIDGVGLGLKRQVGDTLEGKHVDIEHFSGGSGPDFPDLIFASDDRSVTLTEKTNRQAFKNKRAQGYWLLRERFRHTYQAIENGQYTDPELMISLSSNIKCIDQLRAEVCRIPQKHNPNGMIQIMSKAEMAKLKPPLPSPNLADALMMTMPVPKSNLSATKRIQRASVRKAPPRRNWKVA